MADDPWRVLVAWRSQLPPHAVFAGKTAAWLHRLDVEPCNPIEVIAAGIRSRPGLVVRNCHIKEMSIARGLPATTLDVVFRDLRRRLAPAEILVLADQALRLNLGRFHELAEKAESPMETRLRWLLLQSGLPKPEVQANLHDTNGRFLGRADLYYPSAKLVIEYDGGIHRERLVEDNRRQNSILNAGYKLLRFTAADVHQRTDVVVEQVRSSLLTFSYL
ncbi:MAG TPA: DUF559 domain-containing protein [Candidatus Dormibacteraeota bacterium]|nr:DUF559 domain-containing protein [Candidatus Dormibacteraeota bacterium]